MLSPGYLNTERLYVERCVQACFGVTRTAGPLHLYFCGPGNKVNYRKLSFSRAKLTESRTHSLLIAYENLAAPFFSHKFVNIYDVHGSVKVVVRLS